MSYAPSRNSSRPLPGFRPPALQGLGSIQETKSYYVALIETYNSNNHDRSYDWTGTQYMTVWDMNSWSLSLNKELDNGIRQAPMIYSWNGSSWVKIWDETGTM